jgi:hypothetical protein
MYLYTESKSDLVEKFVSDDGEVLRSKDAIIDHARVYYSKLYNNPNCSNVNDEHLIADYFKHVEEIPENIREEMDKDMMDGELEEALKSCKDTTPGIDGIGYEFYKTFWGLWKSLIGNAWKYSLQVGHLPDCNRTSIITLLPKEGKDNSKINNWRPITLTNCDVKIITKAYAQRLAKIADKIIYCNQTAYVPGRSVMDNIRVIKSLAEDSDLDAIVISLDAKKAFDSVSHDFIKITLRKFGFGEKFIKVFETLYTDLKANVLINGWKSELIRICNGVKQGDALSCILFILCVDPLLRNIEKNRLIPRVTNQENGKIFGFADDINAVILNSQSALQNIFLEYEKLTKLCGLELNADKTEIIIIKKTSAEIGKNLQQPAMQAPLQQAPMGLNTTTSYGGTQQLRSTISHTIKINYMNNSYELTPKESIKICGIIIGKDSRLNIEPKITKFKKQLDRWKSRSLTILGKILIVKTFGLSQLIYSMQCCELTPVDLATIDNIILDFIWRKPGHAKRVERIARSIMYKPVNCGGFGLTKARELNEAIKIKQYLRAKQSGHIISKLQETWLNEPHPFQKIHTVDPVTIATQKSLTCHALEWLRRAEELDEHVPWVGTLNIDSLKVIVPGSLSLMALNDLKKQGVENMGQLADEVRNCNNIANMALTTFKSKYSNVVKHMLANNVSCSFKLTDKTQELELDNRLQARVIRSCLMSLRYDTLTPITIQRSYHVPVVKESYFVALLSNIKKLTSTRLKNTFLRVLNGDIVTNSKLHRFKLKDSGKCDGCDMTEDREHLLFECKRSN